MDINIKKDLKHLINFEEWQANYDEAKKICLENQDEWLSLKPNNQGFNGFYMSWVKVWHWLKYNYPNFAFKVLNIGPNYVSGNLFINETEMGSTVLTLSTFKSGDQETPEQLINRVFVKLVAQYTGFGFHLWYEPNIHKNKFRKPNFQGGN